MTSSPNLPHPTPFLEVRVHRLDLVPGLSGVCAGYELGTWRASQLAAHMIEWLPDFALNHKEREVFGLHNAIPMIARAAHVVYTSQNFKKRGEPGEILLHIVLRQVFGTLPAISKIYYKDSNNDIVKGFDAVHVIASSEGLELWLGEAKCYEDLNSAINDVVRELQDHTHIDFLRSEFAAITHKIDDSWEHATRLRKLLDKNTSLDDVFDRACIAVLLAYNSPTIGIHNKVTQKFKDKFEEEVLKHRSTFAGKDLPRKIRVHLFLLPMGNRADLIQEFDKRLKACQTMQ